MSPIFNFDFKFNTFALLTELDRYKLSIGAYTDRRYGVIDNFKILRPNSSLHIMQQECEKFLEYYGFSQYDGEPRYYILQANTVLPVHTDMDTKCSVNHLLEGSAPITFPDIGTYEYSTALLDISKPHGVDNTNSADRYLYKISFFNHSFDEVKLKIMNR